jgi:hypothetical protein
MCLSSAASQPSSGRQSSSVNAITGAVAVRQPRLRAAHGPRFSAIRSTLIGIAAVAARSVSTLWVSSSDALSMMIASNGPTSR